MGTYFPLIFFSLLPWIILVLFLSPINKICVYPRFYLSSTSCQHIQKGVFYMLLPKFSMFLYSFVDVVFTCNSFQQDQGAKTKNISNTWGEAKRNGNTWKKSKIQKKTWNQTSTAGNSNQPRSIKLILNNFFICLLYIGYDFNLIVMCIIFTNSCSYDRMVGNT